MRPIVVAFRCCLPLAAFEKIESLARALLGLARLERAEIAPAPGSRVDFSRIESILTRFQLAYHGRFASARHKRDKNERIFGQILGDC